MLSRAAPQALRFSGALYRPPRALLLRSSFFQPGFSAVNSSLSRHNFGTSSILNARSPKKPRARDHDPAQEEFNTPADPQQNTAPPKPGDAEARSAEPTPEDATEIPLHDLTKGLPSTIDAELAQARKAHEESEAEEQPASGARPGRRMPASAYETSAERRKNKIFGYSLIVMGVGVLLSGAYLGRNWASSEEENQHPGAPSGWGPLMFYNRLKARMTSTMDYYIEPAFLKLLPDPDPAWERPYTLVLSLEDMLIHNEWSREHGWRLAKRPGVDYFLRYLSQYYEIVIFTSLPSMYADPVIRKLDPFHIVMWPLFREATRYIKGKHVKDLSFLNRDLSKVVLIDTDPAHTSLQPENAIILPRWKGSSDNKDLVALIPFLEYVAAMGLSDTRKVLESYKEADSIPLEFARREARARQQFNAQLADDKSKKTRKGSGMGFIGKSLGIKSGQGMVPVPEMEGLPTLSEGFEQGMMLHDQFRLRGQRQYELLEKQIRENGDMWLKEMAAEEEKAKEEAVKGMKSSFSGWFGSGAKPLAKDEKK